MPHEGGRPRRRWRTGQLVVAELTAVAVTVSAFAPGWVFLGVAVMGAAAMVAAFGRAGGTWWFEAVTINRRFRRRRQRAAAVLVAAAIEAQATPPHMVWLRTLAPQLSARAVRLADTTLGVGSDGEGWFAVVEVDRPGGEEPSRSSSPVAVPTVGPGAADERTLWAPDAPTRPPGQIPYRELAALLASGTSDTSGTDRAGVSAVSVVLRPAFAPGQPRPAWVAVRVTPADAIASQRSAGLAVVERMVATAALRAVRVLGAAGWPAEAVDPDRLLAVLAEATGLAGPPQEHWNYWRSGRTVRTHYELRNWRPEHGGLSEAVTQVMVRLDRRAPAVPLVSAVVAAPAATIGHACRAVGAAAAALGVRLRRLDGEQALAAYACAPTAHPFDPTASA